MCARRPFARQFMAEYLGETLNTLLIGLCRDKRRTMMTKCVWKLQQRQRAIVNE